MYTNIRAGVVAALLTATALIAVSQAHDPSPTAPEPVGRTDLRPLPHTDRLTPRQPIATLEGRR